MSEARAYKPRVTVVPATKNRFTAMPIAATRKRRVAAYARVSTNSDEQKTSYEAQVSYYTDYIQAKPDWEFVQVYAERYSLSLIQMHPQPILGCISLGAGCIQGCKDASLSVELYKLHKRDASRALRAEL